MVVYLTTIRGGGESGTDSSGKDNPLGDVFATTTVEIPSVADDLLAPNPLPATFNFNSDGSCTPSDYSQDFKMTSRVRPDGTIELEFVQDGTAQTTIGPFSADGLSAETSGGGAGYDEKYSLRRITSTRIDGEYSYETDEGRACRWLLDGRITSGAWQSGPMSGR